MLFGFEADTGMAFRVQGLKSSIVRLKVYEASQAKWSEQASGWDLASG